MFVLIDRRTMQLRDVFKNKGDVVIQDDKVVTPMYITTDLNKETALFNKYEGKLPDNYHTFPYYYDISDDKFKRGINSAGRMILINE